MCVCVRVWVCVWVWVPLCLREENNRHEKKWSCETAVLSCSDKHCRFLSSAVSVVLHICGRSHQDVHIWKLYPEPDTWLNPKTNPKNNHRQSLRRVKMWLGWHVISNQSVTSVCCSHAGRQMSFLEWRWLKPRQPEEGLWATSWTVLCWTFGVCVFTVGRPPHTLLPCPHTGVLPGKMKNKRKQQSHNHRWILKVTAKDCQELSMFSAGLKVKCIGFSGI